MKRKIIGFDLDGVILNNTDLKIKAAKELGYELTPMQAHAEMIEKIIKPGDLVQLKKKIYGDISMVSFMTLVPGAVKALSFVNLSGASYFLISRRKQSSVAIAALKYHKLWPKYFNEKNAFFVVEPEDKNRKAVELGITHYIDDELRVIAKLVDVKNRFLFDRFGNFKDHPFYTRLKSWPEFISYCRE